MGFLLIYVFDFFQVATVQGLSGTGSLRLAAALIERYFPGAKVLISSPTWGEFSLPLKHSCEICSMLCILIVNELSHR